ncbi:hypothetical protein Fot_49277 [Forsythia ovata]|uniref:Uncharacterized protein n=1 Tax=Forsythia ovata TaxID=205694 RepID=A0ABD1QBF4_9LAMI
MQIPSPPASCTLSLVLNIEEKMDQNCEYMIETATETHKNSEFIRKTLLFLVPVSILSFVLSYISGIDFCFSYNVQFSTLIFSHALDRKYVFLLCNGILAFLAKNLNFSSSSNIGENMKPVSETKEVAPPEDNEETPMKWATASSNGEYMKLVNIELPEEEKAAPPPEDNDEAAAMKWATEENLEISQEEKDHKEKQEEDEDEESEIIVDGEEDGINDDMKVSTEELNKKFEEFIRKMKEEIRIEAQLQQIIAVKSSIRDVLSAQLADIYLARGRNTSL